MLYLLFILILLVALPLAKLVGLVQYDWKVVLFPWTFLFASGVFIFIVGFIYSAVFL
jgi:hypothetical protein